MLGLHGSNSVLKDPSPAAVASPDLYVQVTAVAYKAQRVQQSASGRVLLHLMMSPAALSALLTRLLLPLVWKVNFVTARPVMLNSLGTF